MNLEERIDAFSELGSQLKNLTSEELEDLSYKARSENPWFTHYSIVQSIQGIAYMLQPQSINQWVSNYDLPLLSGKRIGVAMAGNIPMVGFHDLLCVLISGHTLVAKLSSQDSVLMKYIADSLKKINKEFSTKILFEERLKNIDAIIATGSDNTSRYFEYYFRNIPHIIRKNRSSCGIIMGEEDPSEISKLGSDIFSYFGLGCRNISKIYIPIGYEIKNLMEPIEQYKEIIHQNKYVNNYDYRKSIFLVNGDKYYDNGFLLLCENENLVSPISVLYFEYYQSLEDLNSKIALHTDKIQCIASAKGWLKGSIPFGTTQHPELWDYADRVDTVEFLSSEFKIQS